MPAPGAVPPFGAAHRKGIGASRRRAVASEHTPLQAPARSVTIVRRYKLPTPSSPKSPQHPVSYSEAASGLLTE